MPSSQLMSLLQPATYCLFNYSMYKNMFRPLHVKQTKNKDEVNNLRPL